MVLFHGPTDWHEDDDHVHATVHLPGLTAANADVYASPFFVKISVAPTHVCQLDLPHAIDTDDATASITRGCVTLKLGKARRGVHWGCLSVPAEGVSAPPGTDAKPYIAVPCDDQGAVDDEDLVIVDAADAVDPPATTDGNHDSGEGEGEDNDQGKEKGEGGESDDDSAACGGGAGREGEPLALARRDGEARGILARLESHELTPRCARSGGFRTIPRKALLDRRAASTDLERRLETLRREKAKRDKENREKRAREAQWELQRKEKQRIKEERDAELRKAEEDLEAWKKRSAEADPAPWDDVGGDSDDEGGYASVPSASRESKAASKAAGKTPAAAQAPSSQGAPSSEADIRETIERMRAAEDAARDPRDAAAREAEGKETIKVDYYVDDKAAEREEERQREIEREEQARERRRLEGERAAARERDKAAKAAASVPPVRGASGHQPIKVKFTRAVRDVPVREGKAQIEPGGMRAVEAPAPGEAVQDVDPAWLKDRADTFFRSGDIESAVSAYSRAIERSPQAAPLYANRSACHLRAGRAQACIDDASIAIGIIGGVPDDIAHADLEEKQRNLLAKLLVRRGAGHAHLGGRPNAIRDLETALRIKPGMEDVRADLSKLLSTER